MHFNAEALREFEAQVPTASGAHRRVSALDSSSTRTCFTRRSSSRFTGVMSFGSMRSTSLTRFVMESSSASSRPAGQQLRS